MALTGLLRVEHARRPVVRATMCAAATRNRLDGPMVRQLAGALDQAERTPGAEVFLLCAEGDTFCSGLSLGDLDRADWRPRAAAVQVLLARLARSTLVTIASVDGSATGGGVGLAAACDQVVVGPQGSFRLTEVLLGLVPAIILPVLARRVGQHQAFSLALTAREVSGPEAVRLGLADEWSDEPDLGLRSLLVRLRSTDHTAVQAVKRYRDELFGTPSGQQELAEKELEQRLADPRVRERLARFQRQGLLP
jgi:polyketide biosynthesis enoyl-CoA hydratase PksH